MPDDVTTTDAPANGGSADERVPLRPSCHEDAIRFIRQRLLALEEGRDADAEILADYLESEFGLKVGRDLVDVTLDEVDAPTLQRWESYYGLNQAAKDGPRVTVLLPFAAEPIFRIPATLEGRGVGRLETPLHLEYPTRPAWMRDLETDPWDNPYEHLRPRSKDGRTGKPRKLPDDVADAVRVWSPLETD